jgi:hypothetical protein
LEHESRTRQDVDQAKMNVEKISELAVEMQTKDGLALFAYPDPKVSSRAESHRQKHCEILADHSRVFVPVKWIEEDNDPIRNLVLLSQYPELYGWCGKQARLISKDPNEVNHRTKSVLHLELKQCAGAWLFTRILAVNRDYQTNPEKIIHDLKGFIQRTTQGPITLLGHLKGALNFVQIW